MNSDTHDFEYSNPFLTCLLGVVIGPISYKHNDGPDNYRRHRNIT